jgi:hypothetical protein
LGLFVAACGGQEQTPEKRLHSAIENYYTHVERGDWDYTYDHLDSQTQQRFTKSEWSRKNQYFENINPIERAETEVASEVSTSSPVEVRLTLTFRVGTTSRITYFVWENDSWKHRFSPEEYDLFMADASYGEFVAAQ